MTITDAQLDELERSCSWSGYNILVRESQIMELIQELRKAREALKRILHYKGEGNHYDHLVMILEIAGDALEPTELTYEGASHPNENNSEKAPKSGENTTGERSAPTCEHIWLRLKISGDSEKYAEWCHQCGVEK